LVVNIADYVSIHSTQSAADPNRVTNADVEFAKRFVIAPQSRADIGRYWPILADYINPNTFSSTMPTIGTPATHNTIGFIFVCSIVA
jgi:hypothetical protein